MIARDAAIKGGTGWGIKKNGRAQCFGEGWHLTGGWGSEFWVLVGIALLSLLLVTNPDPPHKEYFEECTWSHYCNNFEKSESEYVLSKPSICIR